MRRQGLDLAFERALQNIKKQLEEAMESEETQALDDQDLFA